MDFGISCCPLSTMDFCNLLLSAEYDENSDFLLSSEDGAILVFLLSSEYDWLLDFLLFAEYAATLGFLLSSEYD